MFTEAEAEIGQPVRLVVFDPLGLMLADRDESKNADVAAAFRSLRAAIGTERAAVVIHHSGHWRQGPRARRHHRSARTPTAASSSSTTRRAACSRSAT